jgi:hypothetical protein
MVPPQQPQEVTDVFSLSDQVLSEKLHFVEEVRVGIVSLQYLG